MALPLTLLLYSLLALCLLFIFIGLSAVGVMRLPCTDDVRTVIGPMYYIALPIIAFCFLVAVLSLRNSNQWRSSKIAAEPNFPELDTLCSKFPDIALDEMFAVHDIDKDVLFSLSMEDLKEIGIQSLGIRKKLLAAISALSPACADAAVDPVLKASAAALLMEDASPVSPFPHGGKPDDRPAPGELRQDNLGPRIEQLAPARSRMLARS